MAQIPASLLNSSEMARGRKIERHRHRQVDSLEIEKYICFSFYSRKDNYAELILRVMSYVICFSVF